MTKIVLGVQQMAAVINLILLKFRCGDRKGLRAEVGDL